jgi:hypothetical protein
MNRNRLAGAVLMLAGCILLIAPTATGLGGKLSSALGDPPKPTAGNAVPSPEIPWLTPAEEAQAAELLRTDARARRFLHGRSFDVEAIGPWTTSENERLGASMIVRLSAPAAFPMTQWPAIEYDRLERAKPPYRETTMPAAATNVKTLHVRLDLARGRVVSLDPGPAANVTLGPGAKTTPGYSD